MLPQGRPPSCRQACPHCVPEHASTAGSTAEITQALSTRLSKGHHAGQGESSHLTDRMLGVAGQWNSSVSRSLAEAHKLLQSLKETVIFY